MAQQATPRPGRAGAVPTVCHTHRVSRLRLRLAVAITATATLVAGTASAAKSPLFTTTMCSTPAAITGRASHSDCATTPATGS